MTSSDERAFLEAAIQKHQQNLRTLRLQAIDYGPSAVPLWLHNQIVAEEDALHKWQEKLVALQPVTSADTGLTGGNFPMQPHTDQFQSAAKIKILFLSSDPTDAARLRLAKEARQIKEKLRLSNYRDRFTFAEHSAVRPTDFIQALLDEQPHIVHFSGHGMADGTICLEDDSGKVHSVTPSALENLLKQFVDTVHCVVLNACYAETQAKSIVKYIPYVIGMNDAINDDAAIAFASGFYQALAAKEQLDVDRAFKIGLAAIQLHNLSGHLTPVLKKKT